jgi:hypothetical protein
MSDDLSEEHPGIIDDDPALDVILLDEMEKETRKTPQQNGGCTGMLLLFLLPAGLIVYLFLV